MATTSKLITVAEFAELPDSTGETYVELHHGEVVTLTRPKAGQIIAQDNLADLLKPCARGCGRVMMEMPYRPLPEYEVWTADGAFVTREQ